MKINCAHDELLELHKIIPNPKNPNKPKYKIYQDGRIFSLYKNDFMVSRLRDDGYVDISLSGKMFLVHRLVAKYFLGDSDLEVNHKDGNKQNNNVKNLEYVTRSQNIRHSINVLGNSHALKGFLSPHSKVTTQKLDKMLTLYCLGLPRDLISGMFGIHKETMSRNLMAHDKYSYSHMSKIHSSKSTKELNKKRWSKS